MDNHAASAFLKILNQRFYLLILTGLLAACSQTGTTTDTKTGDSVTNVSERPYAGENESAEMKTVSDSLIFYADSLYDDLEPEFIEISKSDFQSYKQNYKRNCDLDAGRFISGSGLYVTHHCDEICETYLCEKTTNRKMLIPSTYDAGIIDMLLSPDCHQLAVCSSYDLPSYDKYYENRAEIFFFSIATGDGLHGIKPAFKYYTRAWSIDEITWVDNKSIALKVYDEPAEDDGKEDNYKYYKTELNK